MLKSAINVLILVFAMKVMPVSRKLNIKEFGASLVEYGLLVALIAVIAIASIRSVGKSVKCKNLIAAIEIGKTRTASGWLFTLPDGSNLGIADGVSTEALYEHCLNWDFI